MTTRDNPVITVDIRGNRPHIGKTLLARILWKGLHDLGFDPGQKLVTVDCQDRDLDASMFDHPEDFESVIHEAIEKLNRSETRVHFIDRNLPPQVRPTGTNNQAYQFRSRGPNESWSVWKPCSLDTYLLRMGEPLADGREFEVRTVFYRPDGPTIEVSEIALAAFRDLSNILLDASEKMEYDVSYAGEPAGLLKRTIRAQNHALRALLNTVYDHDPADLWNNSAVREKVNTALEQANK